MAGGFGKVFPAWDTLTGRKVACKRLAVPTDHATQERVSREVQHASRLARSNLAVVPVHGMFSGGDGAIWLVLAWMENQTLHDRLHGTKGSPTEAVVRDMLRIAGALDDAAGQQVTHRDVKPANILYDGQWQAFLGDFGLARAATDANVTQHLYFGSPPYTSPERFEGEAPPESDQFSLAAVAFEHLTAVRLFKDGALPIQQQVRRSERLSVRALRPGLSEAVDEVIARGTAPDRRDRYGSCTEFGAALAQALEVDAQPEWSSSLDPEIRTIVTRRVPRAAPGRRRMSRDPIPPPPHVGGPFGGDGGVVAHAVRAASWTSRGRLRSGRDLVAPTLALVLAVVLLIASIAVPRVVWDDWAWSAFGDYRPEFAATTPFTAWVSWLWCAGGAVGVSYYAFGPRSRAVGAQWFAALLGALAGSAAGVLLWGVTSGHLREHLGEPAVGRQWPSRAGVPVVLFLIGGLLLTRPLRRSDGTRDGLVVLAWLLSALAFATVGVYAVLGADVP